jgi:hypothetical protein
MGKRKFEGVLHKRQLRDENSLKKYLVLFDRVHLTGVWRMPELDARVNAEIAYLSERGVVVEMGATVDGDAPKNKIQFLGAYAFAENHPEIRWEDQSFLIPDVEVRIGTSAILKDRPDADIVPIYRNSIWSQFRTDTVGEETVIEIAFKQFPTFSPECDFKSILDFKKEMEDKQWTFRRFLNELGSKKKREAEIVDEFEYLLNDYMKEMDRYKLQRSIGFWETYFIPTMEAFEQLKPSSVLKGLIGIKKRKLALMEGEAKQDGKPIAYVFEAQKRFAR